MKPSVLREMTSDEVNEKLAEEIEALKKLKVNHSVSPLENPLVIKYKRKDVARLHTEVRNRTLQATK